MSMIRRHFMSRAALALTALALALAVSGCAESDTTAADVMREAKEAAATAGQFVKEQVLAYRQAMSTKLEQLKPRMATLGQRAAALAAQGKHELAQQLKQLEAKRAALTQRLAEASAASGEAWKDVKRGLDEGWAELDLAIEQAATRFAPEHPAAPEAPTAPATPAAAEDAAPPASDTDPKAETGSGSDGGL